MFQVKLNQVELPNGARCLFANVNDARFTAGTLGIHVGGINDPTGKEGTAHFLEHAMMRHAPNVNGRFFVDYYEGQDVTFSAVTGTEKTKHSFRGLNDRSMHYFSTLRQLLTPNKFDQDKIELERGRILLEIHEDEVKLKELRIKFNLGEMFAGQLATRDLMGTKGIVETLTPDEIYSFYRQNYTAPKTILSFSGLLDEDMILRDFERLTDRFLFSESQEIPEQKPQIVYAAKEYSNPLVMTTITFASNKPSEKDYMNFAKSEDMMANHIYNEMVMKKGILYGLSTDFFTVLNCKLREFTFSTPPHLVQRTVEQFIDTVRSFPNSDLSERLEGLKNSLAHEQAEREESYLWRAGGMYSDMVAFGRVITDDEERTYKEGVTQESILEANTIMQNQVPSVTFFGNVSAANLPSNNQWIKDRMGL